MPNSDPKFLSILDKVASRLASLSLSIGGDQKDYVARVYLTAAQSIAANTWAKVLFDTKSFDPEAMFDSANSKIIIPIAGYYKIDASTQFKTKVSGNYATISLKKNGVQLKQGTNNGTASGVGQVYNVDLVDTVYCEKGDYVELFSFQDGAGSLALQEYSGGVPYCLLTVAKINKYGSSEFGQSSLLGYAENFVAQSGITSAVDLTGMFVTVSVPSGRRIKIKGFLSQIVPSVSTDRFNMCIKEGSTVLQNIYGGVGSTSFGVGGINIERILSPSSGWHTYKLTLARDSGSGSLNVYSGADTPSFILVELI